jgi:hypothetical protein
MLKCKQTNGNRTVAGNYFKCTCTTYYSHVSDLFTSELGAVLPTLFKIFRGQNDLKVQPLSKNSAPL